MLPIHGSQMYQLLFRHFASLVSLGATVPTSLLDQHPKSSPSICPVHQVHSKISWAKFKFRPTAGVGSVSKGSDESKES